MTVCTAEICQTPVLEGHSFTEFSTIPYDSMHQLINKVFFSCIWCENQENPKPEVDTTMA